ncbi:methyl transferase [Purpureocillium lavendulum]|uniref:Methyl transferase n=1 Tax=Purpureocillium lavendulum TaxID=1247861 RepID=A0AB34FBZ5_9HYPO|nr:methyl transferase [Purpureocillium lavendulum]
MTRLHWLALPALNAVANSAIFGHRLAHLADFRIFGAPGCFDENLGIWTVIEGDVKPGDCMDFNGNSVFSLSNVDISEGFYAYTDDECATGKWAIPEGECASGDGGFKRWGMSCDSPELNRQVSAAPPTPPSSKLPGPQGCWAYGRYYGNWKPGKYLVPIDEEELNRLDIFHKFFLVARDNALFVRNLHDGRPLRILDLGTGTGIWAINVCEESKEIPKVMAVDLNRVQPEFIPRGMEVVQFDIEEASWDDLLWYCDLVHIRMLLGSVGDPCWPAVYRNAFKHLKPGTGVLEQVEIDWSPRWEKTGKVPSKSALKEWADTFLDALDHCNRSARVVPEETRRMIELAGFVDFKEETIPCYVNPWSPDPQEREAARWFNLGLRESMQAMGLMPMIEKMGKTIWAVSGGYITKQMSHYHP